MVIRLTGRRDGLLLAGLALALLTVFDQSLGRVLQFASEVEAQYGVRLLPALVVLVVIFILHLHARRQDMKAAAAAAELEARMAQERTRELEQLAAFGHALAAVLTEEALRAALWRHVPVIAGGHDIWIGLGQDAKFDLLLESTGTEQTSTVAEEVGRRVLEGWRGESDDAVIPLRRDSGYCCFPIVAGRVLGVVGVAEGAGPLGDRAVRVMSAAAALIGIAVRNVQLFAETKENALTDPLTRCFNRGHILQVIEAELRRTRRTRSPLSLLMLDIDQFKTINDRLGHLAGDQVLAAIGARLREVLRHSDVRGRFGGDEFLIVLPDTPLAGALHVAESLRRDFESLQVTVGDMEVRVTTSIGATVALHDELDPAAIVGRVDRALYEAKRAGRNRVMASEVPAAEAAAVAARRAS